jgi:hypothetical protein
MSMLRSQASMRQIWCQTCYYELPLTRETAHTRGIIPAWGDWLMVCHAAMDHVKETGHEPVVVIETTTATYGKNEP